MHSILKLRHWARSDASAGGGRVSSVKLALLLTLGLLVAGGLIGFFLRSRVGTPTPDYLGTGTIISLLPPPSSLHATRPVIIIHHDPIPRLMDEAMSMPFVAASTKLFEGLRPGDRVTFGLKDTPEALLVVSLERLEPRRER
jgi:hypothetical protein